jgi:hypothetical protein
MVLMTCCVPCNDCPAEFAKENCEECTKSTCCPGYTKHKSNVIITFTTIIKHKFNIIIIFTITTKHKILKQILQISKVLKNGPLQRKRPRKKGIGSLSYLFHRTKIMPAAKNVIHDNRHRIQMFFQLR